MESISKRELTKINSIPIFKDIIHKLTVNQLLDENEKAYILSCAILFLKTYNKDKRLKTFAEFSYYIILKYSISYNDFMPLLDFSSNFGFYPITKVILEQSDFDKLDNVLLDLEVERFKKDTHIETIHQHVERIELLNSQSSDIGYIAPTSFGKSSVIIEYIIKSNHDNIKIVIIVPTKSLLMQTYRMIRSSNIGKKIVIHDEMYQGQNSFIAIFTQERALRLLSKNSDLSFDLIFVDEAHNILKEDERSILISRLLRRNRNRNELQKVVYLSPLVDDVSNLRVNDKQSISEHRIAFNVKEPEIYEYLLNGDITKYNRFVNTHYKVGYDNSPLSYVFNASTAKNFIYHYRPIKIENFCQELSVFLETKNGPLNSLSSDLIEVIRILKSEVHEKFYGVDFLKYGIVYLHGKLPDLIKEYLESKFTIIPEIRYVVANMVILEGMNLPIDNLFIFNTRSLYGKELTNLIGRVNRLNQIFSANSNNLSKLLPTTHFVNTERYNKANSKMRSKIELLRSFAFRDQVDNPTLSAFDIDSIKGPNKEEKKVKCQTIQLNESFLSTEPSSEMERIKQNLIDSGISSFYSQINTLTSRISNGITQMNNDPQWLGLTMMEKIAKLFVVGNLDIITDHEFSRLQFPPAQRYYESYITVAQKRALNQNINWLFEYFKRRIRENTPKTYFGSTYGEVSIEKENGKFSLPSYVDLTTKSDTELINLAIVKLKIEDDFVSFKISKFIAFLYDYNLISLNDYNLYTYGTTNQDTIALTKIGLSVNLVSRLEADDQLKNLYIDQFGNVKATSQFDVYKQQANDFFRFEIERFIS